ncbi:unnamed protein product [Cylindrotheca closterium]|uniref:Sulfotransferase domain-containing protein n=1 Tax=Cylindrotheca closterium TaxID=2856 RepID=A0AAD2JGT1_9STRA|nr:unnamed protein product [Cylindrotheca closterium]
MSFFIPKCPILVVCAVVMCFMSKLDPNDYFLPTILFKEKHSNNSGGGGGDSSSAVVDDDNIDKHFVSDNNKNLRIGVQENNNKKDGTATKLDKFANAGKDKAAGSKTVKEQDKKSDDAANVSSSRKNAEVEVVVAKSVSKETANAPSNKANNGTSSGGAAEKPKEGGDSKPIPPSQLRKKIPERTDKPLFILHIGPPKTGTTTLQCELGEKFQELKEENFYYLGTYYAPLCGLPKDHFIDGFFDATRPVLLHCFADHANQDCAEDKHNAWKQFEDVVLSHKDHNVIMSDEMFHHHFLEDDVKRLAKILNPHWDVRIMYTYRHFHSSLPSMYHQLNDPYATQPGMAYSHEKTIWPEDGGYKILSFRESNHFKIDDEMDRFNFWAESFKWVTVFNMHNTKGKDYLPAFLCTMIPESKALCQEAKKTDASKHKDNDSSSKILHYDMLAVEAREEGLLENTKKTREEVRDAVQEFCKSKDWEFTHFPLDCLSEEELDSFLQQSLKQAAILHPYFANPRPDSAPSIESEIRSGFQDYRTKKKFCSVNTKKTLELHPWRQFFLNLE